MELHTHADQVAESYQKLEWISSILHRLTPLEITTIEPMIADLEGQVVEILYGGLLDAADDLYQCPEAIMAGDVLTFVQE